MVDPKVLAATRRPRRSDSPEHIAIVGGGVTGALTSVMLAEAGFRVTVIEKKAIGNGSSSRSAAAQRCQFGTLETCLGMKWAQDFYDGFHAIMQSTPEEQPDESVIRHNGYLWLYEDPDKVDTPRRKEVERAWKIAQQNLTMQNEQAGLGVELLTPGQIAERWPHINPDRLIGGTFCQRDGFLRHDRIYQIAFRRAKDLGVKILTYTEVVGAKLEDDRIAALVVRNDKGEQYEIPVDAVVNATNAWAPRLSKLLGGMDLPIAPVKRYLYFQERPDGFTDLDWANLPFTIYGMGGGRGAYSRPENMRQMMYGQAHPARPEPHFTDEDQDVIESGFGHNHSDESYGIELLMQVDDFAPKLAQAGGLTRTTSGYYADTPDHNFIIGMDPRRPNLLHCAGCSGHGFMHAPVSAWLIRKLLCNEVERGSKIGDAFIRLPEPYETARLSLSTFRPGRDYSLHAEGQVI